MNVDPDLADTGDCRGNTRDLFTHLGFLRKRRLNIDEDGAISRFRRVAREASVVSNHGLFDAVWKMISTAHSTSISQTLITRS